MEILSGGNSQAEDEFKEGVVSIIIFLQKFIDQIFLTLWSELLK